MKAARQPPPVCACLELIRFCVRGSRKLELMSVARATRREWHGREGRGAPARTRCNPLNFPETANRRGFSRSSRVSP